MGVAVQREDYNTRFQDISGTLEIAAADGDTTLVTNPNTAYSIFIQQIDVQIKTDAAQSWSFEDNASTARIVGSVPSSPGVGHREVADYGPLGVQLNEGKNFLVNVSAAGLAGTIVWRGYMRPTAASRAASAL